MEKTPGKRKINEENAKKSKKRETGNGNEKS